MLRKKFHYAARDSRDGEGSQEEAAGGIPNKPQSRGVIQDFLASGDS